MNYLHFSTIAVTLMLSACSNESAEADKKLEQSNDKSNDKKTVSTDKSEAEKIEAPKRPISSHPDAEINKIPHLIKCDPTATKDHKIDVDRKKLHEGVAFVFDPEQISRESHLMIFMDCNDSSESNGPFEKHGSRISGDYLEGVKDHAKGCGKIPSTGQGYYDGLSFNDLFVQPVPKLYPNDSLNTFSASITYVNSESEVFQPLVKCTMNFIGSSIDK